jgi:hypothetical protein
MNNRDRYTCTYMFAFQVPTPNLKGETNLKGLVEGRVLDSVDLNSAFDQVNWECDYVRDSTAECPSNPAEEIVRV